MQVEDCELALLIGYRPASGEDTQTLLERIAAQPRGQQIDVAKSLMAQRAMSTFAVTLDGKPLVPTSVRAKLGIDPGGTRPLVIVLVTYALPGQGQLAVSSRDAKTTRISWTDKSHGRVDLDAAPAQARWHSGVASFLLSLAPSTGVSACATSPSSSH